MDDLPELSPVEDVVIRELTRPHRSDLYAQWTKAYERLTDDLDGAITAAKTLLESTCKLILDETGATYSRSDDLPKLYRQAASQLNMAAGSQSDELMKSFFSGAHTTVRALAELRNRAGDAHGKGKGTLLASRAQAELAVNLAGAMSAFLVSALEDHLFAATRLDAEGRAVLRFDKLTVWRLRDHAQNSSRTLKNLDEKRPIRGLWLVGDTGVYLMSNGSPPVSEKGDVLKRGGDTDVARLVAHAEGCDPMHDSLEAWWPIHSAIAGGDDFAITIPIAMIDAALVPAKTHIIVIIGPDSYYAMSDLDFERGGAP